MIAALVLAGVALVAYLISPLYKGIIGIFVVAFITAATFLYTKYVAAEYNYDIMIASGTPLFIVRQTTGKKTTTLCRIELSSIVKVEREDTAGRREHKTPSGYLKYNYCPTLMPKITYLITSASRYEKAEIRIEASEEFAALLRSYAEEARSLAALEDDE